MFPAFFTLSRPISRVGGIPEGFQYKITQRPNKQTLISFFRVQHGLTWSQKSWALWRGTATWRLACLRALLSHIARVRGQLKRRKGPNGDALIVLRPQGTCRVGGPRHCPVTQPKMEKRAAKQNVKLLKASATANQRLVLCLLCFTCLVGCCITCLVDVCVVGFWPHFVLFCLAVFDFVCFLTGLPLVCVIAFLSVDSFRDLFSLDAG